MDPFVTIETKAQKLKTKTADGAGKEPKWNETFDIDVRTSGEELKLQVFDEDITTSDLVGETTIKLAALCVSSGIDEWFTVSYSGKPAG